MKNDIATLRYLCLHRACSMLLEEQTEIITIRHLSGVTRRRYQSDHSNLHTSALPFTYQQRISHEPISQLLLSGAKLFIKDVKGDSFHPLLCVCAPFCIWVVCVSLCVCVCVCIPCSSKLWRMLRGPWPWLWQTDKTPHKPLVFMT